LIQSLESRTLMSTNLIVNGNFARGATGFSTGLKYESTSIEPEGTCVVGPNPLFYHPVGASVVSPGGSGNMLIVNGATRPNVKIWQETVSVTPGLSFGFSVLCASWGGATDADVSPAIPEVHVNGEVIAAITLPAADGQWTAMTGTWFAKTNTATITLTDVNTAAAGNDSTYDDFSFSALAAIHGSVESPKGPKDHLQPLTGVTVYLDLNNDGILDAGDWVTTTNKSGAYTFTGLAPGVYTVREQLPFNSQLMQDAITVQISAGQQLFQKNLIDSPLVSVAAADAIKGAL
jgi:hypothetical protein